MNEKPAAGDLDRSTRTDRVARDTSYDVAERRRELRRPARPSTRGLCCTGGSDRKDNLCREIVDLSHTGACLLLSRQMQLADEVEVVLVSPSAFHSERRRARVVWQAPGTGDPPTYLTGLEFTEPLSYFDLWDFVVIL